jgi:XTP/dITP diphosphohydrolase
MSRRMQILFATSNEHKITEVAAILAPFGIDVVGLETAGGTPGEEPVEDGATFAANARIKAVHYARATGRPCLADDSGLEVDALDGAPGVRSARYAGVDGSRTECDQANNEKLLRAMAGVPRAARTGRFACAMCLVAADGRVLAETAGTLEGVITDAPRGSNGFGYDPLLEVLDEGRTSAELSADEKNARSHRGDAARAMAMAVNALP